MLIEYTRRVGNMVIGTSIVYLSEDSSNSHITCVSVQEKFLIEIRVDQYGGVSKLLFKASKDCC